MRNHLKTGDLHQRLLTAAAIQRDIVARTTCANTAGAEFLLSVHLNSFDDPNVAGAKTFYNANRAFSAQSRTLALSLQRSIVASLRRTGWPVNDHGIATDGPAGGVALTRQAAAYDQLLELGPAAPPWFSSPSLMPGAVIEPLFLTNPDDARHVRTLASRAAIAHGILSGLKAYFAAPRTH